MALVSRILERLAFVVLLFGGIGMMGSMFLGTGDVIGTQFLGCVLSCDGHPGEAVHIAAGVGFPGCHDEHPGDVVSAVAAPESRF